MDHIARIPGSSVGPATLPNGNEIRQPRAEPSPVNRPTYRGRSTLEADPNFLRREPRPLSSLALTAHSSLADEVISLAAFQNRLASILSLPTWLRIEPLDARHARLDRLPTNEVRAATELVSAAALSALAAFRSSIDEVISLAAFEKRLASILSLPAWLRMEPLDALYGRLECLPISEVKAATDLLLAAARNVSEPLPYRLRTMVGAALLVAAKRSLESGATADDALGGYGRHRGVDVRDLIKFEMCELAMAAISHGESVESVVNRLRITESEDIALLQNVAADERRRSAQRNNSQFLG